jgi:hypothetical protein
MSRKHYREVAEVIRTERVANPGMSPETEATLRRVASGLSHMFGMDNGAFDRAKFMEACGL